jgi:hypothetical protein
LLQRTAPAAGSDVPAFANVTVTVTAAHTAAAAVPSIQTIELNLCIVVSW